MCDIFSWAFRELVSAFVQKDKVQVGCERKIETKTWIHHIKIVAILGIFNLGDSYISMLFT